MRKVNFYRRGKVFSNEVELEDFHFLFKLYLNRALIHYCTIYIQK